MNLKYIKKNKVTFLISVVVLSIILVLLVKFITNYTKKEGFILFLHKDPSFIDDSHIDNPKTTQYIDDSVDVKETKTPKCNSDLVDTESADTEFIDPEKTTKSRCYELDKKLEDGNIDDALDLCYKDVTPYHNLCKRTCSQIILKEDKTDIETEAIKQFLEDTDRNKYKSKNQTDLLTNIFNCELGDICSSNIEGRESNNICETNITDDNFKTKCIKEFEFKACPKQCYDLISKNDETDFKKQDYYKEYETTCIVR